MLSRVKILVLSLLLVALPARAQEEQLPPPAEKASSPAAPGSAEDSEASDGAPAEYPVFGAFSAYVRAERRERIVGAIGGMVSGSAIMAVGVPLAHDADRSPTAWWALGGSVAGLSLLALLAPTDAEVLARKHRIAQPLHTSAEARALEEAWRERAEDARTERYVGAGLGTALSAGAITAGALILSGRGEMSDENRRVIGGVLLGAGIGGAAGSVGLFFVPSRGERTYEQFAAGQGLRQISQREFKCGVAAVPGGAGLSLSGRF